MLVYVRTPKDEGEGDRNWHIPIWFPTVLLFNHLTVLIVWLALRYASKYKLAVPTLGRAFALLHAVWYAKLRHPRTPLVSVDSADGTRVRVRI